MIRATSDGEGKADVSRVEDFAAAGIEDFKRGQFGFDAVAKPAARAVFIAPGFGV